jgi:hypothetical protein
VTWFTGLARRQAPLRRSSLEANEARIPDPNLQPDSDAVGLALRMDQ